VGVPAQCISSYPAKVLPPLDQEIAGETSVHIPVDPLQAWNSCKVDEAKPLIYRLRRISGALLDAMRTTCGRRSSFGAKYLWSTSSKHHAGIG
jgi:hypothetical protein